MRVLIIGGGRFLGRAVAAAALAAGHEVTVFNRGRSGPDVPGADAVRGDRESGRDLADLTRGRVWDVVVDTCGYVPSVVAKSARALAGHADTYVFTSTCSVFRDWPRSPVDDDSLPWECGADAKHGDGDYGTLKAGCERAVFRDFPGRVLVPRVGLLLGPHESIGRLPTWLIRLADAGERRDLRVVAPGDPARLLRPIDVRDVAEFTLGAIERGLSGPYIVAGSAENAITMGDFLGACAEVTGSRAELAWLDDDFLIDQRVGFWNDLPLWTPAGHPEVGHVWDLDTTRAQEAGLRCRPLRETIADTWAWLAADGGRMRRTYEPREPHGLDEERERAVLFAWDVKANMR